jgi:uncharacterized protein YndB with AHSA1/START domain
MVKNEFVITRLFDAPRELVWRAWTDPKHVMKWWGPKNFTAPYCVIDLKVGGTFHFCMRSPDGQEYWNKGVYQEIKAPERIVSTIYFSDREGNYVEPGKAHPGFQDFPHENIDVVTFENLEGGKTRFTLHRDFDIEAAKRYGMDQGWSQSLDKFAECLKLVER